MPRGAAYRAACRRIRAAVGDDTYLLACGAPIIESIGVFDGIRVGPDVGAVWADGTYAAAHPALITAMHRLWLRPAIDPDPDVVYFRGTDLTEATRARLRNVAQVAGFLGTSDPPQELDDVQRATLESFLSRRPHIDRDARHRWRIDGELLDLTPVLSADEAEPTWQAAS